MAKQKRNLQAKDLQGMSIYHEEKRTVYAPFFTRSGYVLSDDNCKEYKNYVTNYLFAFLIFSVTYIITKNIVPSLLLGVLFLIGAIIAFYLRFIKKAATIPNYKRPLKDNFFVRQAKNLDNKRIWTIIVCCVLLAFFIVLNGYINHFEGSYMTLTYFFAAVAIIYGLMHVYILMLKKNFETDEKEKVS